MSEHISKTAGKTKAAIVTRLLSRDKGATLGEIGIRGPLALLLRAGMPVDRTRAFELMMSNAGVGPGEGRTRISRTSTARTVMAR